MNIVFICQKIFFRKTKRNYYRQFICSLLIIGLFFCPWSLLSEEKNVRLNPSYAQDQIVSGQVIFRFKYGNSANISTLQKIAAVENNLQLTNIRSQLGATFIRPVIDPILLKNLKSVSPVDEFFIMDHDEEFSFPNVKSLLESIPAVISVEPVQKYSITDIIPNDPLYSSQNHLPQIFAPAAWEITQGDITVIIAIIDNGFDMNHPDLQSNYWINLIELNGQTGYDDDDNGLIDDISRYDFGDDDPIPQCGPTRSSSYRYGTHVAGIAGAIGNNEIGIT